MSRRLISTLRALRSHENPLGLPRSNAPPEVPRRQRGLPEKRAIKDVKKVIAVSSAKGGVGKSTIAANLALAFARHGHRAGILDTDIFGPSIPTLFGLAGQEPRLDEQNRLLPLSNYGVKTMSMGYLLPRNSTPVVWRGLMVMKALQQLLHDVSWSPGLDVLVLDMPPGTGDTQLTISQQIVLDGTIIISTPQDIALNDAIKGVEMFRKVNVPILGCVQNMSLFQCDGCGKETQIFGRRGGVQKMSDTYGVQMLADIPIHPSICEDADRGCPTVVAEPDSVRAATYLDLASTIARKIGL